jgi:hypothetical protein
MLETAAKEESLVMAGHITREANSLLKDKFGNYIVQHVLGLNDPDLHETKAQLIAKLIPEFSVLAKHKFGSNIMEKCLKVGGAARTAVMVQLMSTTETSGACGILEQLICHPYGNYVVQRAVQLGSIDELQVLSLRIESAVKASDALHERQVRESRLAKERKGTSRSPAAVEDAFRKTVSGTLASVRELCTIHYERIVYIIYTGVHLPGTWAQNFAEDARPFGGDKTIECGGRRDKPNNQRNGAIVIYCWARQYMLVDLLVGAYGGGGLGRRSRQQPRIV